MSFIETVQLILVCLFGGIIGIFVIIPYILYPAVVYCVIGMINAFIATVFFSFDVYCTSVLFFRHWTAPITIFFLLAWLFDRFGPLPTKAGIEKMKEEKDLATRRITELEARIVDLSAQLRASEAALVAVPPAPVPAPPPVPIVERTFEVVQHCKKCEYIEKEDRRIRKINLDADKLRLCKEVSIARQQRDEAEAKVASWNGDIDKVQQELLQSQTGQAELADKLDKTERLVECQEGSLLNKDQEAEEAAVCHAATVSELKAKILALRLADPIRSARLDSSPWTTLLAALEPLYAAHDADFRTLYATPLDFAKKQAALEATAIADPLVEILPVEISVGQRNVEEFLKAFVKEEAEQNGRGHLYSREALIYSGVAEAFIPPAPAANGPLPAMPNDNGAVLAPMLGPGHGQGQGVALPGIGANWGNIPVGNPSFPAPGALLGPGPLPAPGALLGPGPLPAPGALLGSGPLPAPGSLLGPGPLPAPGSLLGPAAPLGNLASRISAPLQQAPAPIVPALGQGLGGVQPIQPGPVPPPAQSAFAAAFAAHAAQQGQAQQAEAFEPELELSTDAEME